MINKLHRKTIKTLSKGFQNNYVNILNRHLVSTYNRHFALKIFVGEYHKNILGGEYIKTVF